MARLRVRDLVIAATDSPPRRELLTAILIETRADRAAPAPSRAANVIVYVDGAELFAGPFEHILESLGLARDDLEPTSR